MEKHFNYILAYLQSKYFSRYLFFKQRLLMIELEVFALLLIFTLQALLFLATMGLRMLHAVPNMVLHPYLQNFNWIICFKEVCSMGHRLHWYSKLSIGLHIVFVWSSFVNLTWRLLLYVILSPLFPQLIFKE